MELVELEGSPKPFSRRLEDNAQSPLPGPASGSRSAGHVPRPLTLSSDSFPPSPLSPSEDPSPSQGTGGSDSTDGWMRAAEVKRGQHDIIRLLRRKRTTSSSSDDDTPHIPTTPLEKSSPSRGYGFPRIGKIPLTPLAKASPKTDRRSWTTDQLIGGKYDVTSKDKSVLERISQRVHRRGSRVRKPHEVFVELEELRADGEGLEWEETARWIKFEEDVEGGRWGRPHISALTFHSLAALRKTLESGCILLDVEGDDYPSIVREIVTALVTSGMLPQERIDPVTQVLYKRHKHASHITLWDKLKKVADRDTQQNESRGHGSSGNLKLREEGGREEGGREAVEGEESKRRPGILRSSSEKHRDMGSGGSLQSSQSCTSSSTKPSSNKRVFFSIASTPSIQATDGVNGTEAIEMSPIREVDEKELITIPNPPLAKTHHHHHHSGSDFLRHWLEEGVMDKIPEDAESLTVLVGGVKFLKEPVVAFVRLAQSHLLGDLTEVPVPVRFIYFLLGPEDSDLDYHEVGRAMATLMSDKHFHEVAYSALMSDDLLDAIDEFLDDTIVLPPGDWDENLLLPIMHQRNEMRKRKESKLIEHEQRQMFAVDPLHHSRRVCGGIWSDLKKLARRYPSDIRDMFHVQTFISILFLYVAFVAPAVAFGGLMEEVTGNQIGETETLVMTGMAGVLYGLGACQPLTILAFTGPVLLFEEVVFAFSQMFDIPYLEWRAVIGVYLMVLLITSAVSEITFLVTKFSRFSEEIFTGIIAIFFTYEATKSIIGVFKRNPLCSIGDYPCTYYTDNCLSTNLSNSSSSCLSALTQSVSSDDGSSNDLPSGFRICNQPNTALWSMMLCLCTFFIALLLTKLRKGKFLGKRLRRIFSDFSMFVAIVTMVVIAYLLRDKVAVETLVVPSNFRPSCPSRSDPGWLINPLTSSRMEIWMYFAALVPAGLLAILIFIENQLTCVVVNKAEHKLQKEVGYHYDLVLVALLNGVCGIMGMPWTCAATVRSVQHVQALSVFKAHNAPGEKPKLLRVYEQRMTNIAVHMLILCGVMCSCWFAVADLMELLTPLAYSVLQLIPISVVLGVFFYLTYSSLSGVQLTKRVKLLFTPPKHHPDVFYVRKVVLVSCLWGLKLSPAGMVYPVAIVGLVPIRWILRRYVFTHSEMEALDSEEDFPVDHDEDDADGFDVHVPY